MNKIYYILIGILVIMFVYMVTDDNCSIERFTQINEETRGLIRGDMDYDLSSAEKIYFQLTQV